MNSFKEFRKILVIWLALALLAAVGAYKAIFMLLPLVGQIATL